MRSVVTQLLSLAVAFCWVLLHPAPVGAPHCQLLCTVVVAPRNVMGSISLPCHKPVCVLCRCCPHVQAPRSETQ